MEEVIFERSHVGIPINKNSALSEKIPEPVAKWSLVHNITACERDNNKRLSGWPEHRENKSKQHFSQSFFFSNFDVENEACKGSFQLWINFASIMEID